MQAYETIEYRGFNINVYYDEDARDPRQEFDHLGKMVCFHKRYNLGDKHDYRNIDEALFYILYFLGAWTETMDMDYQDNQDFIKKYWPKFEKLAIILPLYLYDHSGITMSTRAFSCPWDSGQVGFIYVSRADARKEYGLLTNKNLTRIRSCLIGEVKGYDSYLTGQVFGYNIEPVDANKSIECNESCWGYYGTDEIAYMTSEAKADIDYAIKEYKTMIMAEKDRRLQMNNFMKNCWAY